MPPESVITQDPIFVPLTAWMLHEFAEVTSTNSLAAHLPPWTAVRAGVQTRAAGARTAVDLR